MFVSIAFFFDKHMTPPRGHFVSFFIFLYFVFFCILFFFVFCILVSIACVLNSKLRQTPVASARTAHPLDDNRSCNFPSCPQENTWNKRSTVKVTHFPPLPQENSWNKRSTVKITYFPLRPQGNTGNKRSTVKITYC